MLKEADNKMKEAVGWHELIPGPITGPEEALAFVNSCGFCTWGPVPRLPFPNLAQFSPNLPRKSFYHLSVKSLSCDQHIPFLVAKNWC